MGKHGAGSISETAPGRYRVRVTRGTKLDGRPRTISETVKGTREDAEQRAREIYDALEDDTRGACTLNEYYEQVYLRRAKRDTTRANVHAIETAWKHIPHAWKVKDITQAEPTARELQTWVNNMSQGTARSAFKYFKAILRAAWIDDLLQQQPMKAAPSFRRASTIKSIWDETETAAAWLLMRGHSLEPYVLIAAATGARREEVAALDWEDIAFMHESGEIVAYVSITKAVTEEDGQKETKNEHSARVIPICGYAARRLYETRGTGALIKTKDGRRLGISGLRRQWDNLWKPPAAVRYSRAAGTRQRPAGLLHERVTKVTLNALRHSNITAMNEEGTPETVNQRYHGHAPRGIQGRHYIKRHDRATMEAARRYAAAIEEAAPIALDIAGYMEE